MPKIEIELSDYKQLVHELEILVKVGTLLTVHDLIDQDASFTLRSIAALVFEDTTIDDCDD